MESSKIVALLLIFMLSFTSAHPTVESDCRHCSKDPTTPVNLPPITLPPVTLPKLPVPPVIISPKLPLPPVTVPKVPVPPVTVPKVPLPPVTEPKVPLPPVTDPKPPVPPVTVPKVPVPPIRVPPITVPTVPIPPVLNLPKGKPCPPPPAKTTCPLNTLKLGACVDLLGVLGDPAAKVCCSMLAGLVELEAANCMCLTLKMKDLNLKVYGPLAFKLLSTCGKAPPPGYTCSL